MSRFLFCRLGHCRLRRFGSYRCILSRCFRCVLSRRFGSYRCVFSRCFRCVLSRHFGSYRCVLSRRFGSYRCVLLYCCPRLRRNQCARGSVRVRVRVRAQGARHQWHR